MKIHLESNIATKMKFGPKYLEMKIILLQIMVVLNFNDEWF